MVSNAGIPIGGGFGDRSEAEKGEGTGDGAKPREGRAGFALPSLLLAKMRDFMVSRYFLNGPADNCTYSHLFWPEWIYHQTH